MNSVNTQTTQIRVVVVDNHQLFMDGLEALFEGTAIDVVAKTNTSKGLYELLKKFSDTTIILLDLNLETEDGFDVLETLKRDGASQKIIVLTMYDSLRIVQKVKQSGADGYVLKNTSRSNLLEAIEKVARGESHYDPIPEETDYAKTEIRYSDDFIRKHQLSLREYEVLILLAKSYSTKEIADALFISEQTVSTYRKYIKSKLGLKTIADIVRFVFVNKLF